MPALSPLMTVMTRAAEKAARSLLRDFGEVEQLQVSVKGPANFVSAADRRSEEILFEELSKARPSWSFLMEESGEKGPKDAEARWIIDPLDGTTNFLHGLPHWNISIALEKAGEIVAGLVFDPVKNETFHAEKGSGAFGGGKRLRVSGRKDLSRILVCTSSLPPDRDTRGKLLERISKIMAHTSGARLSNAAALDICYVAAGRYDAFFQENLKPWDVAAASLIVKEAGGRISGLYGKDPIFGEGILAANHLVLQPLRDLLELG